MKTIYVALSAFAAVAVIAGCSGNGTGNLGGTTGMAAKPVIGLWASTSVPSGLTWQQSDRLARPVVNEVFGTVANGEHAQNDHIAPIQDATSLPGDIQEFMDTVFTAAGKKRSQATVNVIKAVLVPDVMKADLSQSGTAAYLGVETGGATGSKFGGRALTDDVVDTSLGIVFGNTISALKLAPDDGAEVPTLTSDHVGDGGKHFTNTFPYLGTPR